MVRIAGTGAPLGAVVEDLDVAHREVEAHIEELKRALATHGYLCFPRQRLSDAELVAFTRMFGPLEVNVANTFDTEFPEVMVLSNIVRDGKPIGLSDAGQGWHTDMSYSQVPGLATALYAIQVPRENGRALGDTEFSNMQLAYQALPEEVRKAIEGRYAVRDFAKFWNYMIERKGSSRPPLTIEQRRKKPPVFHPLVIEHPITGRKSLYADPAYTVSIIGLPKKESDDLLEFLFQHQVRPEFTTRHIWSEGDLLIWDNLVCIHQATGGYGSHQPRRMHRTQIILDTAAHPGFGYTDNNVIRF